MEKEYSESLIWREYDYNQYNAKQKKYCADHGFHDGKEYAKKSLDIYLTLDNIIEKEYKRRYGDDNRTTLDSLEIYIDSTASPCEVSIGSEYGDSVDIIEYDAETDETDVSNYDAGWLFDEIEEKFVQMEK